MREPFQVLVIPFVRCADGFEYCLLRRADADYWQWIAGGGEEGESPAVAAKRETMEETGLSGTLYALSATSSVPVSYFKAREHWSDSVYVIPEYSFAIEAPDRAIVLSGEHTESRWIGYPEAMELLHWQSNQTALWELAERLVRNDLIYAIDQAPTER